MPYNERFVAPMREELTRLGVRELRTPADVDAQLSEAHGTTLVVVNSICGCAARNARPAVAAALQHATKPKALTTVFAGQDLNATERARRTSPAIVRRLPRSPDKTARSSSCSSAAASRDAPRRDRRRPHGAFDAYCATCRRTLLGTAPARPEVKLTAGSDNGRTVTRSSRCRLGRERRRLASGLGD